MVSDRKIRPRGSAVAGGRIALACLASMSPGSPRPWPVMPTSILRARQGRLLIPETAVSKRAHRRNKKKNAAMIGWKWRQHSDRGWRGALPRLAGFALGRFDGAARPLHDCIVAARMAGVMLEQRRRRDRRGKIKRGPRHTIDARRFKFTSHGSDFGFHSRAFQ